MLKKKNWSLYIPTGCVPWRATNTQMEDEEDAGLGEIDKIGKIGKIGNFHKKDPHLGHPAGRNNPKRCGLRRGEI